MKIRDAGGLGEPVRPDSTGPAHFVSPRAMWHDLASAFLHFPGASSESGQFQYQWQPSTVCVLDPRANRSYLLDQQSSSYRLPSGQTDRWIPVLLESN